MRTFALSILLMSGCTATARYAVRAPATDPASPDSCYRSCQLTRVSGADSYIGCIQACPGVQVSDGKCPDGAPETGMVCIQESFTRPNHAGTVVMAILLNAVAVGLAYAALP